MSNHKNWLKSRIEKYSNDADYILEGKILDLTEQISLRLKELKWSKKDLAEKLKTSQANVTKLLNGNNNFTLSTLVKISEILDLNLEINMSRKEQDNFAYLSTQMIESAHTVPFTCEDPITIPVDISAIFFKGISGSTTTSNRESFHKNRCSELN